jgi:hypothetical protein
MPDRDVSQPGRERKVPQGELNCFAGCNSGPSGRLHPANPPDLYAALLSGALHLVYQIRDYSHTGLMGKSIDDE